MAVRLVGFHPLDSDSDYANGNVEKNFIKLSPGGRCSKIFFDKYAAIAVISVVITRKYATSAVIFVKTSFIILTPGGQCCKTIFFVNVGGT